MATITKASLFLVSVAIAKFASAGTLFAYPDSGCNDAGYYQQIDASNDACTKTYLTDTDFKTVGDNSGEYQAFFKLKTEEGEGCALVIGMDSSDATAPPCGECVSLLHSANKCIGAQLPTPFYAWECCGAECQTQCGQIPAKRSVDEAIEALQARNTTARSASPDIANLKNRAPLSAAPLAKRADCSFTPNGGLYTQAGTPTKVSDTETACASADGCSESYSGTVESSFSQGFDVSESTEAGFFDIVSETVTFGYSATWESSKSVMVSGSHTFSQGQSGYITFAPLSQCNLGTFSGADCGGMGIPTGGDARSACVPEMIAGGQINGDIAVVTTV